jgi:hypothetical protein
MTKRQLIDEIRQYNTTARLPFLEQFNAPDLEQYLSHLRTASLRNVRIAGWVKHRPRFKIAS